MLLMGKTPISVRSSKTAKEIAARKHLAARSWEKFFRDANFNISSSLPTAIASVEYLNPLNGDWSAVVNGNPGFFVSRTARCVADCLPSSSPWRSFPIRVGDSVDTVACSKLVGIIVQCG